MLRFSAYPNIKGEKITRSSEDFKKKNLLINFWASWTDSISNHQSNSELKELYQKYKKNKHIAMLGVSFDIDKKNGRMLLNVIRSIGNKSVILAD